MKADGSEKIHELTINKNGLYFRRVNPNPLTANQKFYIILSMIGAVAVLPFWTLFW